MRTEQNCTRLYRAMYLKRLKEVMREQRPSLCTIRRRRRRKKSFNNYSVL